MAVKTKTKKKAAGKKSAGTRKTKSVASSAKSKGKAIAKTKRSKTAARAKTKKSAATKPKIISRKAKTGQSKAASRAKTAKRIQKPKSPPIELSHGQDLHLIPITGDFNSARIDDSARIERVVHHNQDILMHQENNRVKQAMASHKSRKGMFRNFRQS